MSRRTATLSGSLVVAAALLIAPVAPAFAGVTGDPGSKGATRSEVAKARATARTVETKAHGHNNFVLGGTVTAVDAAAGSLSFTVHGGRYKALRTTVVTVTVAPTAKVTRDGATTLAQVLVGDHVVVKSRVFEVTGTRHAELLVSATVHRVAASSSDADTEAPEAGATASPSPLS